MEEKVIDEYPTYAITNTGFVRDLRTGNLHDGHNQFGYRAINLTSPECKRTFLIHRLVAQAFIPNPDNLPEVDHIDRNPSNNTVSNLRWADDCIQSQNRDLEHSKRKEGSLLNIQKDDDTGYYRVVIVRNKKVITRKRFTKLEDAIKHRDETIARISSYTA